MADETVAIKITDGVDGGIAPKIRAIESSAKSAHTAITKLNAALAGIKSNAVSALGAVSNSATAQIDRAAMASQRLATATARTQAVQAQAATAAQRLATAQQQTATASANAAAAGSRAAQAALRLQQAQNAAAAAANRLSGGLAGVVRQGLALAGAGFGAAAILGAADAYTVLQNKLQNVSESLAVNNRLTREVFELANKTRSPVLELATAFSRFDAALQQAGASQKESLRITETVTKALKVGGATAGETGSALLQLSQAFNKGKLNGDEFRSLMENMPVFVKKAIAEAAKIPLSGIFDAAAQGKITIDTLREAFGKLEGVVDAKFAKTIGTVADAWIVFKNNMVQAIGEINKSLGITQALSGALKFLGENLGIVGVAIAAFGGLMILYFGPNLIAMFGRATLAVRAFTIALATNPLGLIAVAISTAVVAMAVFSDKMKLIEGQAVTLRDLLVAVWERLTPVVEAVAGTIEQVFYRMSIAIGSINKGTVDHAETGWLRMIRFAAQVVDKILGFFVGLAVGISNIFDSISKAVRNNFDQIGNYLGAAMSGDLGGMKDALAANANGWLDFGKNIGKNILDGASQGFDSQHFFEGELDAALKRAKEIAAARTAETELRGAGPDATGGGGGGKGAEKRALALAKINGELDKELNRLFMLKPEREIQEQFDKIEIDLLGKKIKLTDAEATAIKSKLKALQDAKLVQAEFDRIYEESVAPMRDYNNRLTAANMLLKQGAISQEDYAREIRKATDAKSEALDPFFKFNEELRQEREILQTLPQYREVEQRLQQLGNELRATGRDLNGEILKQKREELILQDQLNKVAAEENRLYAESNAAKREAAQIGAQAINNLLNNPASGYTKGDAAQAVIDAHPELDFSNTQTALDAHVNQFADMYAKLDVLREQQLISEQTYAAMRTKIWVQEQQMKLNQASDFFGNLAQLQKSSNATIAKIGKAAAIAQALIQTYQSATAAYAAMAGIPVYGPALGAAAAAAAVVAGLANVAQIRAQPTGFMAGGYTGNIPETQIAGAVHGREYVMDAGATARIGKGDLEALRSGAASVQRNDGSAGTGASAQGGAGGSSGPVVVPAPEVSMNNILLLDPAMLGRYMKTAEGRSQITTILTEEGFVKQ